MSRWKEQAPAILAGACAVFALIGWIFHSHELFYLACLAGALPAGKSMLQSLRDKIIDVNLLMLLAAIGAIAIGRPEDAAILLFLFSLSGALESAALSKARSAIEGLVKLRPREAVRLRDGVEEIIPVEDVKLGDVLRIPPNTAIPVDGEVTSGVSSIDQSAMTGESIPVEVSIHAKVIGGTLNQEGLLAITATSVVGDSTLDRVMSLVQEAQDNKAGGERLSQWLGQWYTIGVVGAFVVSFLIRFFAMGETLQPALYASLTLLVALSPCALVISVPAATLSALAWCGRNGLLVRGGEFIERAGKVTAIAFDKTGTLTRGRPSVVEIYSNGQEIAAGSPEGIQALRLVASAEAHNPHPVARALAVKAEELQIDVPMAEHQEDVAGRGVHARVDGKDLWIGKARPELPQEDLAAVDRMREAGLTVAVLEGNGPNVLFGVRDEARADAHAVLERFRAQGISPLVMLTGDQSRTAHAVAAPLGLDLVLSDLLPHEKEEAVRNLVEKHKTVMMVGDGANDAPSLARAYLGVGMGGLGNETALAASDVVLMQDSLQVLPDFLRLGRRATGIIRANLILAGGMVIALTIGSLLGKLPMPLAVLGHEGSTVIVILNGLRLLGGPGR